jgi:hypothetical protein
MDRRGAEVWQKDGGQKDFMMVEFLGQRQFECDQHQPADLPGQWIGLLQDVVSTVTLKK